MFTTNNVQQFDKKMSRTAFWVTLIMIVVGLTGCDLVSSIFESKEEGFGSTAGPVLYIGKKNKPFTTFHAKQLYSMDKNGNNVKQLTDSDKFEVVNAKWSPDGDRIVMVKNNLESGYRQNMFVVDHQGKNERTVIKSENDRWGIQSTADPVWSPDGQKIAFVGATDITDGSQGKYDIYIVNLEKDEIRKITNTPRVREVLGNWGVDGNIYASELYLNTSPMRTQMVAFDETGEIVKNWERYLEGYNLPILSHDGNYMMFMKGKSQSSPSNNTSDQTDQRVLVMPENGEPEQADTLTRGSFKSYRPVTWSPDDNKVLVMGTTDNQDREQDEAPTRYHILKVNRDGTGLQEITPETVDFYYMPVSWIAESAIGPGRNE